MKTIHQKSSLLSLLLLLVSALFFLNPHNNTTKEAYRQILKQHPYSNPRREMPKELAGMGKPAAPDLAWEQDYLRTMDPTLGRPAQERLPAIIATLKNNNIAKVAPGSNNAPWVERGPNNVGGRTRALAYDPSDLTYKKVWAGGVTGGLWYNQDITSSTSKWISVSSLWANLAVTCIAFDPIDSKIMYVGTGEGFGTTASSSRGMGIFKSTDAGKTFTHLSNTSSFYYVNDLIVRNEKNTSVLYAAVDILYFSGQWHGDGNSVGLFKSSNGGGSFSNVMPKVPSQNYRYSAADLELDKDNRIWIGTRVNEGNNSDNGGGRILYTDDGTNFTVSYQHTNKRSRVEIACAPGTSGTVYAVFEGSGKADTLIKTVNNGSSWSSVVKPVDADAGISKTDFTRGQA
jgi:hypothetical protein